MRAWKNLSQTRWAKQNLRNEIEDLKNRWAIGGFTDDTVDRTAQINAESIGIVKGLFIALDVLTEDEEEDENEG